MVDTQVSEACSARCEGSSPSLGTNNFLREVLEPSLRSGLTQSAIQGKFFLSWTSNYDEKSFYHSRF